MISTLPQTPASTPALDQRSYGKAPLAPGRLGRATTDGCDRTKRRRCCCSASLTAGDAERASENGMMPFPCRRASGPAMPTTAARAGDPSSHRKMWPHISTSTPCPGPAFCFGSRRRSGFCCACRGCRTGDDVSARASGLSRLRIAGCYGCGRGSGCGHLDLGCRAAFPALAYDGVYCKHHPHSGRTEQGCPSARAGGGPSRPPGYCLCLCVWTPWDKPCCPRAGCGCRSGFCSAHPGHRGTVASARMRGRSDVGDRRRRHHSRYCC